MTGHWREATFQFNAGTSHYVLSFKTFAKGAGLTFSSKSFNRIFSFHFN